MRWARSRRFLRLWPGGWVAAHSCVCVWGEGSSPDPLVAPTDSHAPVSPSQCSRKRKKKKNFFNLAPSQAVRGVARSGVFCLMGGRHVQGPAWCRLSRTCVSIAQKL